MKLDIRINVYFVVLFSVLFMCTMLTLFSLKDIAIKQLELQQQIEDSKAYTFDYDCFTSWDSKYYNCQQNESYRNITGNYCGDKLVCENSYRPR